MAAEAPGAPLREPAREPRAAPSREPDAAPSLRRTHHWPRISVILPVRNEAESLPRLLGELLAQEYPRDRFEILVADGRSTDRTREVVLALAAASQVSIRLVDNARQRSGAGRNAGVLASTGEVILFIDGHCSLPSTSLLADTARLLAATGAACLCRPQPLLAEARTATGRMIAAARASWLGHGRDSLIYNMDHAGFVDPASSGATYRREVFTRVGLYDEHFDACEDVELNTRVRKAGLAAYTHPSLAVYYEPRPTLGLLWLQMVRYGRGRVRLMAKHRDIISAAQLAPAFLLLCCGLLPAVLLAETFRGALPGTLRAAVLLAFAVALPVLCFAGAALLCGLQLAVRYGRRAVWQAPIIFAVIYAGLGAGLWVEAGVQLVQRLSPPRRGPACHAPEAALPVDPQAGD